MKKKVFLLSFYFWFSCGSHETNNTTEAITAVCLLNSANGSSVNGKAVFEEINNKVTLEIDVKGDFNINIDIFKKDGGQKESKRLGVPLLGKIPLSKEIMNATDSGIPIVVSDSNQKTGEVYFSLADKVSKIIKL